MLRKCLPSGSAVGIINGILKISFDLPRKVREAVVSAGARGDAGVGDVSSSTMAEGVGLGGPESRAEVGARVVEAGHLVVLILVRVKVHLPGPGETD